MDFYKNTDKLAPFLDRLKAKEHVLLCALGDSNTCNTNFTAGAKQWPELLHSKLRDVYSTQTVLLVNSGVSGNAVNNVLDRFETDVARFRPDCTALCLGSNDANRLSDEAFETGMNECIDRILALDSLLLLRTPTPIMEYEPKPEHLWKDDVKLQSKIGIIRKIAEERECPFVDIYGLWHSLEAEGRLDILPLMHDAVHTNGAGHALVFEHIMQVFDIT